MSHELPVESLPVFNWKTFSSTGRILVDILKRLSSDQIFEKVYYRVAKTHRVPYLYGSFSAKEPYN